MVFGMTMIKVNPSQDNTVHESIRSIKGVKEIYSIFGEYSFFLIMEAYGGTDLGRIVDEINSIENIMEICPIMVTEECDLLSSNPSDSEKPAIVDIFNT